MAKKRFTLRIDEELNKKLEEEKWKKRKSKNSLIEHILNEWIKRQTSI